MEKSPISEWPDGTGVDLRLLKNNKGPESTEAGTLFQNYDKWLYVMIRVPCTGDNTYIYDVGQIAYSAGYNGRRISKRDFSDVGGVYLNKVTHDGYGWDETNRKLIDAFSLRQYMAR